jgi:hypothetical protein
MQGALTRGAVGMARGALDVSLANGQDELLVVVLDELWDLQNGQVRRQFRGNSGSHLGDEACSAASVLFGH